MRQLRYLLVALCGWFFLLYNVERIIAPINIASFVYIFVPACTILLLLSVQLCKLPIQWLFALVLPPYFILKWFLGLGIGGDNLALTIVEVSAISLTVMLTRVISVQLAEWQKVVTSLTIGEFNDDLQPFDTGQAQIYREIRRARRHQRAAALLAITAVEDSSGSLEKRLEETSLYRFIEEVKRETLEKYISARLADVLVTELGDLAIVTKRNDHFVTLLPETDRASLYEIVRKLQAATQEKLGLKLKIGISTFPDEAVTFETMLENAEAEMTNDRLPIGIWVDTKATDIAKNGVHSN